MALWDPSFDRTFKRLQRDMDSVWNQFERDMQVTAQPEARNWAPRCDVKESGNQIQVHVELPGVPKDQIHVHLDNGVLTLSGERKAEMKDEKDKWHRVERSYGAFEKP